MRKYHFIIPIFLISAAVLAIQAQNASFLKETANSAAVEFAAVETKKTEPEFPAGYYAEKTAGNENCAASSSAKAALIKDLSGQKSIFEFNNEIRWPIASLSKLMTSLIAVQKMKENDGVIISEKAAKTEGFIGELRAGEIYKVKDLIKAMLTVSSNDAAEALSENIGGEKEFAVLMNEKAKEIGMKNTIFVNSSGLSFINQSTADDLAELSGYIFKNYPEIFEISRQKENVINELASKKSEKLANINKFAGRADFIGGKSGYLEASGRNLISLFKINGKHILTVVLGADDAYLETEALLNCAGLL